MDDTYENPDEYNRNKKHKILILVDDMIVDMLNNRKLTYLRLKTYLRKLITELFVRGRKPKITLAFITPCYFAVRDNVRLNSMHNFIMTSPSQIYPPSMRRCSDVSFSSHVG